MDRDDVINALREFQFAISYLLTPDAGRRARVVEELHFGASAIASVFAGNEPAIAAVKGIDELIDHVDELARADRPADAIETAKQLGLCVEDMIAELEGRGSNHEAA